jgi:hypothetical protein
LIVAAQEGRSVDYPVDRLECTKVPCYKYIGNGLGRNKVPEVWQSARDRGNLHLDGPCQPMALLMEDANLRRFVGVELVEENE